MSQFVYQNVSMWLPWKRVGIEFIPLHALYIFCVLRDCDCVIVCHKLRVTNCVDYIYGRMYIGKDEH